MDSIQRRFIHSHNFRGKGGQTSRTLRELDFGKSVTQVRIQVRKGLRTPSFNRFAYRIVGDGELGKGPQSLNYQPTPDIGEASGPAKDADPES